MKRNLFTILLATLCLVPQLLAAQSKPTFSSGSGSASDPYKISNKEDLEALATLVTEGSSTTEGLYFIQTADIDFKRTYNSQDTGNFPGIGNASFDADGHPVLNFFSGHYDGQNHAIIGMCIVKGERVVGLFAGLNPGATLKNLTLKNSYLAALDIAGLFVGINNKGIVSNCHTDNKSSIMTAASYIGGVVCNNALGGTVEKCSNAANILSIARGTNIGGVVGDNEGKVSQCFNSGNITAGCYVGGIVGFARESSTIEYCYNTGAITGQGNEQGLGAGGIVGVLSLDKENSINTVSNCYNVGVVKDAQSAGAIVGHMFPKPDNSKVINCYFATDVEGATDKWATGKSSDEMKADAFIEQLNGSANGPFMKDNENANNGFPVLAFQLGIEAAPSIEAAHVKIVAEKGCIHITDADGTQMSADVNLFTTGGERVMQQHLTNGQCTIHNIPAGAYIVKVGNVSHKVLVP